VVRTRDRGDRRVTYVELTTVVGKMMTGRESLSVITRGPTLV
jgi:hypothetical protein